MRETTRPPTVCVSSNVFDSMLAGSNGRIVDVTPGDGTFCFSWLPLRQFRAMTTMNAMPTIGSATRRMRIVRCTPPRNSLRLSRIPRVDDVHARARGGEFVGLEVEEDVALRAHELREEGLRGGPDDGGGAAAFVLQEELAAAVGEGALRHDLDAAREKERLRVAGAERLEQLVRGQQLAVDLGEHELGVDARDAAEEIGVERREVVRQACAQLIEISSFEREAAGELVAAEVREELVYRVELRVKIDRRNAPRGADAEVAVDRDRQRRAVIALGDAARGQADDAAVPSLARDDDDPLVAADLLLGLVADLLFDVLALGVEPVELRAELPGAIVVGRGEEIDRRVGRGEAAGGVDARPDFEADVYGS